MMPFCGDWQTQIRPNNELLGQIATDSKLEQAVVNAVVLISSTLKKSLPQLVLEAEIGGNSPERTDTVILIVI